MRLVKAVRRTRIGNLRPGAIFMLDKDDHPVLAVKSQYASLVRTDGLVSGSKCDCYLLASGEYLCGGTSDETLVYEMRLEDE